MHLVARRTSLAVLAALAVGVVVHARTLDSISIGVYRCHNLWNQEAFGILDRCHGNIDCLSDPDNGLPAATSRLIECLTAALTGNSSVIRDFVYVEGSGTPNGVIYRFQKPADMGTIARMTVYNGSGDPATSFADATVRLNGVVVAEPVDFDGQTAFDREVTLVDGENELRIEAPIGESGALVLAFTDVLLAPPN